MCGVCGIIDYSKSAPMKQELLEQMTLTLRHRGPDRSSVWTKEHVGLGHARLSIIDLSETGNQPMTTPDGRYVIVFNGEVYNFTELRAELERNGAIFRGHSDTEVVLAAYSKWGATVFPRLNGIFALAIWDNSEKELILARDRFGVKPLYIYKLPNGIIFGSEIKAILASGRIYSSVSPQALHEFAYFGASLGTNTMFEGITRLEPGHWIRIKNGIIAEDVFWQTENILSITDNLETATTRTIELLEAAVKRQLISDVPVGVFLSGGIDSSAVTAFAARHYAGKLNTYSVGFDFKRDVDELPKARRVARHYGTEHHELFIEGGNLPPVIEDLVKHHDEPFSDAANIPLYLLCRELNGNPKVVLQGDGGDEIFAGYRRYNLLSNFKLWKALASIRCVIPSFGSDKLRRLRRILDAFAQYEPGLRMAMLLTMDTPRKSFTDLLSKEWKVRLHETDAFKRYREMVRRFKDFDAVQQMLYTDVNIILPDIFLEKVDKSTMAFSIESRVPFLDNDLTEYVMGLPSKIKVRGGDKKFLLKRALRKIVPDDILDGPKTGFGVPFSHWLKEPLAEYSRGVFAESFSASAPLFDKTVLTRFLADHQKGDSVQNGFILWKALNLALWQKFYLA